MRLLAILLLLIGPLFVFPQGATKNKIAWVKLEEAKKL